MSELIDNRKHRQEQLKAIIKDIHAGADPEEIKGRFGELLDQIGATEIGELEQSLIAEGLPVEKIQRLCDVHVAVFKESLEKQAAVEAIAEEVKTNPVAVLEEENEQIRRLVKEIEALLERISDTQSGDDIGELIQKWEEKQQKLAMVDGHYIKKENIIFPYLERYGISGPPSVMWGIHDEIRASLKSIDQVIANAKGVPANPILKVEIGNIVLPALNAISEMVYKEERILFPMCRDTFTVDEWKEIEAQLSDPFASVERKETADQPATAEVSGGIELDVGVLTPEQINLMLTHLPIDITFVDANDEVRYFSLGPERIFERARAVIGRKVQFCHPPKSMGVVEQILEDFRSGRKDSADFWINMKGELVYIRYFAVRDENGVYQGTLEVTQNITEIQKITGEKRIYDYSN